MLSARRSSLKCSVSERDCNARGDLGTASLTVETSVERGYLGVRIVDDLVQMDSEIRVLVSQGLADTGLVRSESRDTWLVSLGSRENVIFYKHFLGCLICPETQSTACAFDNDCGA